MIPMGKPMRVRAYSGHILRWLLATAAAMFTTFLLAWLGANSTTAGMVFLVLVVWSASQAGIALSLYMAALCALFFDYFFLPPVHTLRLVGAQAWVEMISFALGLRRCQPVGGARAAAGRAGRTAAGGRGTAVCAQPGDDAL